MNSKNNPIAIVITKSFLAGLAAVMRPFAAIIKSLRSKSIALLVCLAVTLICSGQSQTEKKRLTNSDVVEMVKGGLAEAVVIAAIQSNPGDYDTSPAALIDLNKQGITAKMQEAMLSAQKGSEVAAGAQGAATAPGQVAGTMTAPMPNAVAYVDGTKRIEMKQSQAKMETSYAFVVVRMKQVFEGKQAQLRVSSESPTFEVSLMGNLYPSDTIVLFKPAVKKEQREIFAGGAAPFTQIKPDKKKDTLPLAYEEVSKENGPGMQLTVYRVKPTAPLPRGEYALCVFNAFYCFGVDSGK